VSPPLRVFLSPLLFQPDDFRGGVAVVIDQHRASCTIAYALAAGASAIVPCEEVEEAKAAAAALAGSLLGGERGGVRIDGFDLGNSPSEYTPDRVGGKVIVFTTTNGTRALRRAAAAERVIVGALPNRRAVAHAAAAHGRPVYLVCAGIRMDVCAEDVIAAGAMVETLRELGADVSDDAARLALQAWQDAGSDPARLLAALHASQGGRNLARVGLGRDVEDCARVDALNIVPVLEGNGRLVAAPVSPNAPGYDSPRRGGARPQGGSL
jgi:2-phosphosulfolactate phosphatase